MEDDLAGQRTRKPVSQPDARTTRPTPCAHHKALLSFEVFKQLSFLLCGFDHNIPFLLLKNEHNEWQTTNFEVLI